MKKPFLFKVLAIVLFLLLFAAVIANGCFCYVSYKLSIAPNIFEKLDVVKEYNIFHNLWLCTFSSFITVVLLITTLIVLFSKKNI